MQAAAALRLCYFTSAYPAPSHTTMRREIQALERLGVDVVRAAARPFPGKLVEAADRHEAGRTAYTALRFASAALGLAGVMLTRPLRLLRALCDAVTVGAGSAPGRWKYLMYLGQAGALLRIAHGSAHLHANFGHAVRIAVMCRVLGGPALSLRIHGPEEYDTFTAAEWDWMLHHASFVSPVSEYGVQRLHRTSPHHRHKVALLRCGIDAAALASPHAALPQQPRLCCVARLEPRKGHAVLLEALSILRSELPATLLLVGDGSLRESLAAQAQELGIGDAIEFVGWQGGDQVLQAMQQCRAVVLPSHAEGLPIVLMEALALGRVVVATEVAGIPELVRPGVCGWLVPAGDAAALAAALRSAVQAPDVTLAAMAAAGRELVRELHSADLLMRELLARISAAPLSSYHMGHPRSL